MHYISKSVVRAFGLTSFLILGFSSCNSSSDNTTTSSEPHHPPRPLFVADRDNGRISAMDGLNGGHWNSYTLPASGQPSAVAFDSSHRIYIADSVNSEIIRVDDFSGTNEVNFGALGSGSGQFNAPQGLSVDSENRIYVSDSGNNRVVRIDDMTGTNWTSYGTSGSASGQFDAPTSLTLDPSGRIYVVDTGNSRVVRVDDLTGTNWVSFGSMGTGADQFQSPSGMALGYSHDALGNVTVSDILISDTGNDRVVLINDLLGTGWTALGSSGNGTLEFDAPSGVSFGPHHEIFVSDSGNDRLVEMSAVDGNGWTTLGSSGSGNEQFNDPGEIVR